MQWVPIKLSKFVRNSLESFRTKNNIENLIEIQQLISVGVIFKSHSDIMYSGNLWMYVT